MKSCEPTANRLPFTGHSKTEKPTFVYRTIGIASVVYRARILSPTRFHLTHFARHHHRHRSSLKEGKNNHFTSIAWSFGLKIVDHAALDIYELN
jgi:hypothetical protein